MKWTELETQSRKLVDQLRRELRGVDVVTLEESEAAEMAGQLLDRAALRELREDDPAFVREVAEQAGLARPAERGEAAFEEGLRRAVVDRMCGVMFARLRETRGTPRIRRRQGRQDSHLSAP